MMKKIEDFFSNNELLELAFTHKSWVNENMSIRESNERLEFLGDAILEYVVSKELYIRFPQKEEGYLTTLRANLVNTINLAKVARKLDLGARLFLSVGEQESGGRENQSLLANTVEAVIGGMFLDKGIDTAEEFVHSFILNDIDEMIKSPLKDAKSRLQELVQAQGHSAPKYRVANESGPDHDKEFVIEVTVAGKVLAEGTGKNKALAAQSAANEALKKVQTK